MTQGKFYFCLLLLLIKYSIVNAQRDSNFCKSYENLITGRIYLSQKYTRFNIKNGKDNFNLGYRPNTTLNLGIGATYKWATLNLAYGFPVLNPENGQGKTKYLDLQAHFYGSRFTTDVFGQFYKGFYLYPKGTLTDKDHYYIRPDLAVNAVGVSVQYVFNHKRFSYRAAFLQNEWQRKSCGSLIAGAEFHLGEIRGDSSFVSTAISTLSGNDKINSYKYFKVGPNVGYAYTLVIHKNYFISASLAYSFDYIVNTSRGEGVKTHSDGLSPNTTFRIFTGYNSSWYAFSITFINSDVSLSTQKAETKVNLNTGNFRLNYVRRFNLGPRSARLLRHL